MTTQPNKREEFINKFSCKSSEGNQYNCLCEAGVEDVWSWIENYKNEALTNRDKEVRERVEVMKLPIEPKYDGNNLEEACQTYCIAAQNWTEILRLEDGYNRALDDVLNILDEK